MVSKTTHRILWQQFKLPVLLLGGIALGSLPGVLSPALSLALKPVGDIFLNLMFTIVVPLVFASIASMIVSRLVEGKNWMTDRSADGARQAGEER